MYSWKWVSFALCLMSVPLRVAADPPDHAANKKPPQDVLMARHAEAPAVAEGPPRPAAAANEARPAAHNGAAESTPQRMAATAREPRVAEVPGADGTRQRTAAAANARGQRSDMLEGLRAGQGNLNAATQRLEQAASLRERAEQARSHAWTRWKAKLLTEGAIDPQVQRELEKHARREAKLQRLGALAQQAGDTQALQRLAKLQALEASLHENHMQALLAKSDRSVKEPAQP
jgi:hypothetical protein